MCIRDSDKEAIFVKEELKRTYKPKTEARVRLAGTADEKQLHICLLYTSTILEPENMIKPVKLDIHPNR